MYVDGRVTRLKFDKELAILRAQHPTLATWGCFVVRTQFPEIDAVFMPRRQLNLLVPLPPRQYGLLLPGVKQPTEFIPHPLPPFSARPFGVRITLDDFDLRAPSVTFRDPWTWELMPPEAVPRGHEVDPQGKALLVVLDQHPGTKRTFLCMRGTREYHEHPQHTGDDWMLYRAGSGVFSLLTTVWRTCILQAQPGIMVIPQAPTAEVQLQIATRWDPPQKR